MVANKVPASMHSRLLDYVRPGRKARATSADYDPGDREATIAAEPHETAQKKPEPQTEVRSNKVPLDYPLISSWLRKCEEDLERGRDRHEYSKLSRVFEENGCTRIDDIQRLSPVIIRDMATDAGELVSIGLVHRVFEYASEDVAYVKKNGKLA